LAGTEWGAQPIADDLEPSAESTANERSRLNAGAHQRNHGDGPSPGRPWQMFFFGLTWLEKIAFLHAAAGFEDLI